MKTNEVIISEARLKTNILTLDMIWAIKYEIYKEELEKIGFSPNVTDPEIEKLDCIISECLFGFMFMVLNCAHSWFPCQGYVSKVLKLINID